MESLTMVSHTPLHVEPLRGVLQTSFTVRLCAVALSILSVLCRAKRGQQKASHRGFTPPKCM